VTGRRYEVELSSAAERALRKLEKSDRRTAGRIVLQIGHRREIYRSL